ncbi:hypothetical protein SPLC1_S490400 [Arthrospira platensis C1]|nr:hypothetical protein SPLC1_S490400 [Arthrospira platensis C1]
MKPQPPKFDKGSHRPLCARMRENPNVINQFINRLLLHPYKKIQSFISCNSS